MTAILLFLLILIGDQVSKYVVVTEMVPGESLPIIGEFFHLTYVLNPGAAFGLFAHQRWFFVIIALVLIGAVIYFYPRLKREGAMLHYGTVAMAAGAIGNLIDRIRTGLVIDFFDFRVWPVFNVADIAIVLGVIAMIYAILFQSDERERKR